MLPLHSALNVGLKNIPQFWDAKKGVVRRTCIECREVLFYIMYCDIQKSRLV